MKSYDTGKLALRAAVIAVVLGAPSMVPVVAQAPIVQAYNFSTVDITTPSSNPAKFINSVTGANGFSSIDSFYPTTHQFIQGTWDSIVANVPDSFQARQDAGGIPAGWFLQSVQFSYSFEQVNWLAWDNGNSVAVDVNYTITGTGNIRHNNSGGTLIDTVSINQASIANVPTDGVANSLPAATGLNFPFEVNITGSDSLAFAPNAVNEAKPGAANPPIHNSAADTTTLTSVDGLFTTFEGPGPLGGNVPIYFDFTGGTTSDAASLNVFEAIRSFSTATLTVTYTFVPEPETWAAGVALGFVAASVGFRRWRAMRRFAA